MLYRYLYQTSENENRSGEIRAANRAEAYAALRRQGIRPYRVIGDDPRNWKPLVFAAALVVAVAALAVSLSLVRRVRAARFAPMPRAQITGDRQVIAKGAAEGWVHDLASPLDRALAVYAQPGWRLDAPGDLDADAFAADLDAPSARTADETDEVRQLRNIIAQMRGEMRDYLATGGTVEDYFEFLAERQAHECDLRDRALEVLARAPVSMRRRAWLNLNIRLGDMGIAPLPSPD